MIIEFNKKYKEQIYHNLINRKLIFKNISSDVWRICQYELFYKINNNIYFDNGEEGWNTPADFITGLFMVRLNDNRIQ